MLLAGAVWLMLQNHETLKMSFVASPVLVLLVLYGISIVVSTFISTIISNMIMRPVLSLSQAFSEVAKGNFDISITNDSGIDEISSIYANFNSMVSELGANETLRNDFVANVSHEFKTPITAIEGYATLLQDKSQTPQEQDECIEKILFNTRRLSNLVGNILMLSKIENQSISSENSDFLLDEQILQVVVSLEQKWTEKEIEFDVDMPKTKYYGYESLLMQVWSNIIGNAIKFSPQGGTIGIKMQLDSDNIIVKISDEGIGMSEATQKHIFEKFYQADTSRKSEGNGLGLALAAKIVEYCGGTISVESELGAGSCFIVTLPLVIAQNI
jgi:signal transduction histidine kinase